VLAKKRRIFDALSAVTMRGAGAMIRSPERGPPWRGRPWALGGGKTWIALGAPRAGQGGAPIRPHPGL